MTNKMRKEVIDRFYLSPDFPRLGSYQCEKILDWFDKVLLRQREEIAGEIEGMTNNMSGAMSDYTRGWYAGKNQTLSDVAQKVRKND